jgi:hypothetical protein
MAVENEALVALGENLISQVVKRGINGAGLFKGAVEVAEEHLATSPDDPERAIRRLIATHTRLAAASGFVTGLGGVATLPVAIPAALAGLYILSGRMAAGIAHLRGYDVDSEEVRSAVLVSLLGSSGTEVLKKAGIEIGRQSTAAGFARIPGRALIEINKRVGFRLVTKAGQRGVINLGKLVPLVGGPVGAAVDGIGCRTIAAYAVRLFPPLPARAGFVVDAPDAIDAEVLRVDVDPR